MIRIGERLKAMLLHPRETDEQAYRQGLQEASCYDQPLLIETVGCDIEPRCALCLYPLEESELRAGAGLTICGDCGEPNVVLRVLGGKFGTQWFSFPWPK
jgi:hypothetical protein